MEMYILDKKQIIKKEEVFISVAIIVIASAIISFILLVSINKPFLPSFLSLSLAMTMTLASLVPDIYQGMKRPRFYGAFAFVMSIIFIVMTLRYPGVADGALWPSLVALLLSIAAILYEALGKNPKEMKEELFKAIGTIGTAGGFLGGIAIGLL